MIFGELPVAEAEGAILAHSIALPGGTFKKGRRLGAQDLVALSAAGLETVTAGRLEPGDVHEDAAAEAVAKALCGPGLGASAAFTGRCNLLAAVRGLTLVDAARLDRLNLVDEAVTVATLADFAPVEARQMVATIKIIPFAIPGEVLERCLAIAKEAGPVVQIAAFAPRRVGLVQTSLPGQKEKLLDKTLEAVNARLAALDCPPAIERRCAHEAEAVGGAIAELRADGADIVLVSGASAIVDRRDVVPSGILAAGGAVDHFGMPVDPGNLILMGHVEGDPVIGLPGCARSPKLNGFDWILQRLVAGLAVRPRDIMTMGAGGLLKETGARPLPRAEAVDQPAKAPASAPRIAAVVLAAGRSRRARGANKLLTEVDGRPLVARAVASALASAADPVVVVTGHERERVEAALAEAALEGEYRLAHNPDYAAGLSTSLHRGLAALPETADGAIVCLADMPFVGPGILDRLIAAFDPVEGRSLCVPTWQGKRGNPVLLARRFFTEAQAIAGDVGARALLGEYPEAVCEVAMDDLADGEAILRDLDTPAELAALRSAG